MECSEALSQYDGLVMERVNLLRNKVQISLEYVKNYRESLKVIQALHQHIETGRRTTAQATRDATTAHAAALDKLTSEMEGKQQQAIDGITKQLQTGNQVAIAEAVKAAQETLRSEHEKVVQEIELARQKEQDANARTEAANKAANPPCPIF
jgi:acetyl/propionyl-CoA carboxylase alpha subunit